MISDGSVSWLYKPLRIPFTVVNAVNNRTTPSTTVKITRRTLLWLCAEATYLPETGTNISTRVYLRAKLEVHHSQVSLIYRAQKADAASYAAPPPLPPSVTDL